MTLLQTNELVQTQAYQQGNTKEALVQVFLRLDEMLSQESVQDELQALAGPKTHADEEEEYVHPGCLMAADVCCVCVSSGDNVPKCSKCHLSLTSSAHISVPTVQTNYVHKSCVSATIPALSCVVAAHSCSFLFGVCMEQIKVCVEAVQ